MESRHPPTPHREYEDLLAAAALGTLTRDEHLLLRRHMDACASCRATLAALQAVGDALTLTVDPLAPSPGLRARLMAEVRAGASAAPARRIPMRPASQPGHAHGAPTPLPAHAGRGRTALWALAAAAVIALAVLGGIGLDRFVLQREDDGERTIALQFSGPVQEAEGTLRYLPEEGVLHLHAENLPALAAGQVYQAWLIDGVGPRAVGVIDAESGELAVVTDPERDAVFAITLEPGPLGSETPTSDPVIVAELES